MATKRKIPTQDGGLDAFRKAVQELRTKSQTKITGLTTLADSTYDEAVKVVQILVEEILAAPVSRLQPLLSVVDSILKKVGRDYKQHLSLRMLELLRSTLGKADAAMAVWLSRMVNESWRKHDLLPPDLLDRIDALFASGVVPQQVPAGAVPAFYGQQQQQQQLLQQQQQQQVQQQQQLQQEPLLQQPPVLKDPYLQTPVAPLPVQTVQQPQCTPPQQFAPKAAPPPVPQAPQQMPEAIGRTHAPPLGPAPPMKAPPPKPPPAAATPPAVAATSCPPGSAHDSPELVEKRLRILTKIIERKSPEVDELQEIMKVPEIRKAIFMQQKGQRQEAMALLSAFKQDLERKHRAASGAAMQEVAVRDPRSRPGASATPPAASAPGLEASADPRRPSDPRQVAAVAADDPRRAPPPPLAAAPGVSERSDVGAKRPDAAAAAAPAAAPQVAPAVAEAHAERADDGEAMIHGPDDSTEMGEQLMPARQILQGLPSIGFSEAWLRQFMEQMPTSANARPDAPSIGRKVLGASGDQMVYVDELVPQEVLLLLQLVFMLEERVRRSSNGEDLAQRIPHSFCYLQVDTAMDVMLKRFFDELPYQCTMTGLRFASREKLKKHHDALYRRRAQQQQRQRGGDARGWMESIPEWVGNRDLVVGPALFRLGGTAEEALKATESQRVAGSSGFDGSASGAMVCVFDERRSVCPISGEPFERFWSESLNDWAFNDVAALELGSSKPLRFPRTAHEANEPDFTTRLSETAVLFKRSCFEGTPPARRMQALEECRGHIGLTPPLGVAQPTLAASEAGDGTVQPAKTVVKDPDFVAFAQHLSHRSRVTRTRFF